MNFHKANDLIEFEGAVGIYTDLLHAVELLLIEQDLLFEAYKTNEEVVPKARESWKAAVERYLKAVTEFPHKEEREYHLELYAEINRYIKLEEETEYPGGLLAYTKSSQPHDLQKLESWYEQRQHFDRRIELKYLLNMKKFYKCIKKLEL